MRKTWIAFLLPNDEYKEQKLLQFLAEGAILLLIYMSVMLLLQKSYVLSLQFVLLIGLGSFLTYVFLRYISSGLEFSDVATEEGYRAEVKRTTFRTLTFVALYLIGMLVVMGVPSTTKSWKEYLLFIAVVASFQYAATMLSLRISYRKNKDLL